jgi:fructose-bisphosphate aldolase class I|tara:strand:+ start:958 stop:1848 length:891 start_codon:yes stop_codon:yes gene_type:complete
MARADQAEKMTSGPGFVAALDQSGGSTPKALKLYGIDENAYKNDDQMFDLIHQMRCRIIQSPAFNGNKVIGAILFENTMDREVAGKSAADFLWDERRIVPFLKVDKGLADENNGVQLMKPMPDLESLLERASAAGIFGTKMRSVINRADNKGIEENVSQQFEIGQTILGYGLVPIIEPEVNIKIEDKAEAEEILLANLIKHLDELQGEQKVMLKLTLPEKANLYSPAIDHAKVMRVVALSGGYTREESNLRLRSNLGMTASFSRALTEGLSAQQSDEIFNNTLSQTINDIYEASIT